MGCRVAVMEARRAVLGVEVKVEKESSEEARTDDAFDSEVYGMYIPPIRVTKPIPETDEQAGEDEDFVEADVIKRSTKKKEGPVSGVKGGNVQKEKKSRMMLSKAEAAKYDERIRKYVKRYGWGNWKRLERSGKLPESYTARVIAKRAKALKLDKDKEVTTKAKDAGNGSVK